MCFWLSALGAIEARVSLHLVTAQTNTVVENMRWSASATLPSVIKHRCNPSKSWCFDWHTGKRDRVFTCTRTAMDSLGSFHLALASVVFATRS